MLIICSAQPRNKHALPFKFRYTKDLQLVYINRKYNFCPGLFVRDYLSGANVLISIILDNDGRLFSQE